MNRNSDTGKRGAVRNKSGQPVDDSGPGLRVGPTTSETAGRKPEACPPNSLIISQHKSRRESESGALSVAREASDVLRSEATQWGSFLEKEQINCKSLTYEEVHRRTGVGRKKYCGKVVVWTTEEDGTKRFIRVDCGCWDCAYCGPRKARRVRYAIRDIAEKFKLNRLLTLTLDPKLIDGQDPVAFINNLFAKWRVYLKNKFKVSITYIRILEFQQNGNPHFHILVDRFIEQPWIRATWSAIGGGSMVDIRLVDIHRIATYLSKYLTKQLLMSAPKRCRRVTVSRGICLFAKSKSKLVWSFLRKSIWDGYSARRRFLPESLQ